jgi:hypothetical protein
MLKLPLRTIPLQNRTVAIPCCWITPEAAVEVMLASQRRERAYRAALAARRTPSAISGLADIGRRVSVAFTTRRHA